MTRLVLIVLCAAALAACATEPLGPAGPAPPVAYPPASTSGSASVFRQRDFAWSTSPGSGSIVGALGFHVGQTRYSCEGRDVILTPETPWSRLRMIILYGSPISAAVPLEIVRARTPAASSGDYASFVRKTTCDGDNRFAFGNLPNGGWFVITLARPVDAPGEPIAVMRRVETRGAQRNVTLY
ncbi:MAG: hypothetical protein H0X27_11085 [Caulobacteraceae bacterium]|nr:hypothetical protein [Caulobacteraceae bacterium]